MGFFGKVGSFLGIGPQTTTTSLDPRTQAYVDQQRKQAQGASNVALTNPGSFFAGPSTMSIGDQASLFMNPYQQQVIDATHNDFNSLRSQAAIAANHGATAAGGAFGSRAAIAQGARLAGLDRAEMSQVAGLRQSGYENALSQGLNYQEYLRNLQERQQQEPLFRQQQALNFTTQGMGPFGTSTTTPGPGLFGIAAGVGQLAMGAGWNPFGNHDTPSNLPGGPMGAGPTPGTVNSWPGFGGGPLVRR